MPTTSHTVTLEINGTDYTSLLKRESLYVRHSIGNENGVCDFTIKDSPSYRPQGWDSVAVKVNGTVIFGGFIFQHDGEVLGTGATAETQWQVQCKDWSILLDQVIVETSHRERSDKQIIASLFGAYLGGEGFDVSTNVATVTPDLDIAFQRVTLREALNMLASRAGVQWYIGPDKKLSWQAFTGFSGAAFNIDTVSPNNSTTFNVAFGSLHRQIDESTIINRVVVIGGNSKSGTRQTDTFEGNGTTDTFGVLTKEPHSIWKVDYWINGGRYIRYTTNIGYEPGDKLFSEGGSFEIVCNLELQTVRIQHIDGSVPDDETDVVIDYYYQEPVTALVEHTGSQAYYGRTFTQHVFNQELTSRNAAIEYGQGVLTKQAFGRETITFDVYEHGLQPGTRITINAPSVGLGTTVTEADLALEYDLTVGLLAPKDAVLWENSDTSVLENLGADVRYVIQEVQYQPVITPNGSFMMLAKVSVGDWQHTLIDALQRIGAAASATGGGGALSSGSGRTSNVRSGGKLSNFANDLGDIAAGRAIFTDGGSGIFSWDNYASHTGVVTGLEDKGDGFARGVVYILDGGTVKAKLGRMAGMPNVGTISPTGWGLWTDNGFFSGVVAASEIIGGTVRGGLVSGGTVSGALVSGGTVSGALLTGGTLIATIGTIGGFRIGADKLWSDGGTIATGSIVNSSNPGVYLNSLGLFGFGTLGMTFKIPTNPAEAPWFSSGTINNVVYEVYESAILRTSSNPFNDGGIQMDNSGLFGINPQTGYGALLLENDADLLVTENNYEMAFAGLNFMLDTQTGLIQADGGQFTGVIHATDGRFSGLVEASRITGGTIVGATIEGFTITGQNFTGVTITASSIVGGTVSGAVVTGGLFTGGTVSGGTVSAARFEGGTVSGGLISGGTVSSGRFEGGTVTGALVAANTFQGGTVNAAVITASAIQGNNITGGTISAARFSGGTITGGLISGQTITGGTVSGGLISGGTVSAAVFTGNSSTGGTISGAAITANQISGGTVTGAVITAGQITGGTISSPNLFSVAGGTITMGTAYGITFNSTSTWPEANDITWRQSGTKLAEVAVLGNSDSTYGLRMARISGGNVVSGVHVRPGGTVGIVGDLVPDGASPHSETLGGHLHGWRHLYLVHIDGGGNQFGYKVSVTAGGSLVTELAWAI